MKKSAIITGGSRGIGKDIALAFAKEKFNIALTYTSTEPRELIKEIKNYEVDCIAIKNDVSNFNGVKDFIDDVYTRFKSIDVLVNNAGITKDSLLIRMNEFDFDRVIEVNLKGAFNTIRHVSSYMIKQRYGSIINITSISVIAGNIGQLNYSASKAGIIGLTKTTAKELASRGITCNAIAPGFIETDMTRVLNDNIKNKALDLIPLNRFGTTYEIAQTAVFLYKNKYITGQVITVDGGLS